MKKKKGKKVAKRTYYLPPKLMVSFKSWCLPGRDYSTKVAGAILFYMTLTPNKRRQCEKLAHSANISDALSELKKPFLDEQLQDIRLEIKKIHQKIKSSLVEREDEK